MIKYASVLAVVLLVNQCSSLCKDIATDNNTFCLDVNPVINQTTTFTFDVTLPSDYLNDEAKNLDIILSVNDNKCVDPHISFSFENIDYSNENEIIRISDLNGLNKTCGGGVNINGNSCGDDSFIQCLNYRNMDVNKITADTNYHLSLYQSSHVDASCNGLSLNAEITVHCLAEEDLSCAMAKTIVHDWDIENNLELNGWTQCYFEPYTAVSTRDELITTCDIGTNYYWFVGAMKNATDERAYMGAYAPSQVAYDKTTSVKKANKPLEYKNDDSYNVYWYMNEDLSFGFAPNKDIELSEADKYDLNSNDRLSWHLNGDVGGWRAGKNTWLQLDVSGDNDWMKVVYFKYCEQKEYPYTTAAAVDYTSTVVVDDDDDDDDEDGEEAASSSGTSGRLMSILFICAAVVLLLLLIPTVAFLIQRRKVKRERTDESVTRQMMNEFENTNII